MSELIEFLFFLFIVWLIFSRVLTKVLKTVSTEDTAKGKSNLSRFFAELQKATKAAQEQAQKQGAKQSDKASKKPARAPEQKPATQSATAIEKAEQTEKKPSKQREATDPAVSFWEMVEEYDTARAADRKAVTDRQKALEPQTPSPPSAEAGDIPDFSADLEPLALQRAVVWSEILGPPLALREDE